MRDSRPKVSTPLGTPTTGLLNSIRPTGRRRRPVEDDPDFSPYARITYGVLLRRVDLYGEVEIFADALAAIVGVKKTHVSRLVSELRDAGVIQTRKQGAGKPLAFTLPLAVQISCYSEDARCGPPEEALASGRLAPSRKSRPARSRKSDARPAPARKSVPPDPPSREYLYMHAPPGAPARAPAREYIAPPDVVVVHELVKNGVTPSAAHDLAQQFPDRCRAQLDALPMRPRIRDRGAYLRRAIERDYALPLVISCIIPPAAAAELKAAEIAAKAAAESAERAADERIAAAIATWPAEKTAELRDAAFADVDRKMPPLIPRSGVGFCSWVETRFRDSVLAELAGVT